MAVYSTGFTRLIIISFLLLKAPTLKAQDERLQYPLLLQKAYFGIDFGSLNFPFSNKNLIAGYSAEKLRVPTEAVRITLFGYRLTPNLSARITYTRPVEWVVYKNINGDNKKHTVWMNVGGLTVKQTIPLFQKLSLSAEAGLAMITRHGFSIDQFPAMPDVSYASFSAGGGLQYRLNSKWDLNVYASYSPGKPAAQQPHATFFSGGFEYNMNALPQNSLANKKGNSNVFPKQTFQVSYTTNSFGYGANHFFGEGKIPVFWGGNAAVEDGIAFNYRRNVFHTAKTFSLDVASSIGKWESSKNERSFFAVSIYPVMRFTVFRSEATDFYFLYSVAGPTYISKTNIDDYNTGKSFTFRDYMGVGGYFGKQHIFNGEISIGHFSNGNIFPNNAGIKIPLSFTFGYAL